jgi:hypothetical protein
MQTQRDTLRARLARCEAEAADIRAQLDALDRGDAVHQARAKEIVRRMADIEREARQYDITADDDRAWATHPLAVEYRALMCEWWALPIPIPHRTIAESPSQGRMLTARTTIAAESQTPGERHMTACSRHQRTLRAAVENRDPAPHSTRAALNASRAMCL